MSAYLNWCGLTNCVFASAHVANRAFSMFTFLGLPGNGLAILRTDFFGAQSLVDKCEFIANPHMLGPVGDLTVWVWYNKTKMILLRAVKLYGIAAGEPVLSFLSGRKSWEFSSSDVCEWVPNNECRQILDCFCTSYTYTAIIVHQKHKTLNSESTKFDGKLAI